MISPETFDSSRPDRQFGTAQPAKPDAVAAMAGKDLAGGGLFADAVNTAAQNAARQAVQSQATFAAPAERSVSPDPAPRREPPPRRESAAPDEPVKKVDTEAPRSDFRGERPEGAEIEKSVSYGDESDETVTRRQRADHADKAASSHREKDSSRTIVADLADGLAAMQDGAPVMAAEQAALSAYGRTVNEVRRTGGKTAAAPAADTPAAALAGQIVQSTAGGIKQTQSSRADGQEAKLSAVKGTNLVASSAATDDSAGPDHQAPRLPGVRVDVAVKENAPPPRPAHLLAAALPAQEVETVFENVLNQRVSRQAGAAKGEGNSSNGSANSLTSSNTETAGLAAQLARSSIHLKATPQAVVQANASAPADGLSNSPAAQPAHLLDRISSVRDAEPRQMRRPLAQHLPAAREQIAVRIQKAFAKGMDRLSIQLKPAELGRVDVHLELRADQRVTATVLVERPETLDMLQRDARGLEQALRDAGLKAGSGNLQFSLRGEQGGGQSGEQDNGGNRRDDGSAAGAAANESEMPQPAAGAPEPMMRADGSLDLMV